LLWSLDAGGGCWWWVFVVSSVGCCTSCRGGDEVEGG